MPAKFGSFLAEIRARPVPTGQAASSAGWVILLTSAAFTDVDRRRRRELDLISRFDAYCAGEAIA
jgi:hypothetical protein